MSEPSDNEEAVYSDLSDQDARRNSYLTNERQSRQVDVEPQHEVPTFTYDAPQEPVENHQEAQQEVKEQQVENHHEAKTQEQQIHEQQEYHEHTQSQQEVEPKQIEVSFAQQSLYSQQIELHDEEIVQLSNPLENNPPQQEEEYHQQRKQQQIIAKENHHVRVEEQPQDQQQSNVVQENNEVAPIIEVVSEPLHYQELPQYQQKEWQHEQHHHEQAVVESEPHEKVAIVQEEVHQEVQHQQILNDAHQKEENIQIHYNQPVPEEKAEHLQTQQAVEQPSIHSEPEKVDIVQNQLQIKQEKIELQEHQDHYQLDHHEPKKSEYEEISHVEARQQELQQHDKLIQHETKEKLHENKEQNANKTNAIPKSEQSISALPVQADRRSQQLPKSSNKLDQRSELTEEFEPAAFPSKRQPLRTGKLDRVQKSGTGGGKACECEIM